MKIVIDQWGIPNNAGIVCADFENPSGLEYPVWTGSEWVGNPQRYAERDTPTQADTQAAIIAATQARLDTFARTRNYDGILSAATYATSTVPRFAAEGKCAVDARDQTWSALYALMGEVLAGALEMPTGFEEVEKLLPTLAWPE